MELDDADLVQAFREGDRDAFALLIGRHRPRIVGLATALLGDAAAAEDVAQEATYHAYFDVERLRDPSRFGAWLCGIAVNLAKMSLRRQRFAFSLDDLAGGRHIPGARLEEAPSPELVAETSELRQRVEAALNLLPLEMRAAVWLHYVEGLTYQEVGAITGIAPGTLRVLSHRARQQLREALADEWQPRPEREEIKMIEVRVEDVAIRIAKQGIDKSRVEKYHPAFWTWAVVLKPLTENRAIHVFMGAAEGEALASQLAGLEAPRPLTYTLMAQLLSSSGVKIERVTVTRIDNDVFFATVTLSADGKTTEVDARPSDALNLALRADAPIFLDEEVLAKAGFEWAGADDWHGKMYGSQENAEDFDVLPGIEVVRERREELVKSAERWRTEHQPEAKPWIPPSAGGP